MDNKGFYLKTCNTCMRILGELELPEDFDLQEVKTRPVTAEQVDELAEMAGGYEPLFNRRSRKYRELGLNEKELTEQEYRQHIIDEYTFLKRPAFVVNGELFLGNSKKTVEALKQKVNG